MDRSTFEKMLSDIDAEYAYKLKNLKAWRSQEKAAVKTVFQRESKMRRFSTASSHSASSISSSSKRPSKFTSSSSLHTNEHKAPLIKRVEEALSLMGQNEFTATDMAKKMGEKSSAAVSISLYRLATRDHKLTLTNKGTGRFNPHKFVKKNG